MSDSTQAKQRNQHTSGIDQQSIKTSSKPWSWTVQINGLNSIPDLRTLIDKVSEILPRNFALCADLYGLLAFGTQSLHGALETGSEIVGWVSKDFAD